MITIANEIYSTFPELKWEKDFVAENCECSETEFLEMVCYGKCWRELDEGLILNINFTPSLFLSEKGSLYLLPALLLVSMNFMKSDIVMHAINSVELVLSERRPNKFLNTGMVNVIRKWLVHVNINHEGGRDFLPAGILLSRLGS